MCCSFINSFLYQVSQFSFQVYKAVDACKSVLRGLHSNQIAPRELDRVSCLFCLLSLALFNLFSLLMESSVVCKSTGKENSSYET